MLQYSGNKVDLVRHLKLNVEVPVVAAATRESGSAKTMAKRTKRHFKIPRSVAFIHSLPPASFFAFSLLDRHFY